MNAAPACSNQMLKKMLLCCLMHRRKCYKFSVIVTLFRFENVLYKVSVLLRCFKIEKLIKLMNKTSCNEQTERD